MTEAQQSIGKSNLPPRSIIGEDGLSLWSTRTVVDDEHTPWAWLALLSAAALVLRVIGLNSGLWYDEIITVIESVRSPLYEIVTEFPGNNQHVLFSVLAHLSTSMFGEHAWSVRLPSLVFGVAAVPVLYLFARQFVTRLEALLACVLLTTAYHHVWFSQNARGYSALACLTLLSSWLLMRGLRRGRTIDAVWYGLAAALGVYAHLTMMFLVVSHALLCGATVVVGRRNDLLRQRGRFAAMAFGLATVFTLLLYSPILLDVRQFFVTHPNLDTPATPAWAVGELIRGLKVGLGAGLGAIVGGLFFAAGIRSYFKQSPFVLGVFVLPGVVTVGAALALGRPVFPRFVFFLIGFALLIAVRGALEIGGWVGRRWTQTGPVLVLVMAAVSLISLVPNYRYPKQDFEGALRFVEDHRAAGEKIATVGLTRRVYREYYRRSFDSVTTLDELQTLRADGRQTWVLYTLERYIEDRSPDLLWALQSDCVPEAVFRGTVGDGDVTVCRVQPIDARLP
ncbi:MAG: glycosyltransferase family 39 protein [Vicinamibacterales bacterium]